MASFRRDPRRAVGVVVVDGGGEEEMVMVGEEEGDERAKGTGQGVTGTRMKTLQLRFYILHFGSETDINIPGCQTAKLPLMTTPMPQDIFNISDDTDTRLVNYRIIGGWLATLWQLGLDIDGGRVSHTTSADGIPLRPDGRPIVFQVTAGYRWNTTVAGDVNRQKTTKKTRSQSAILRWVKKQIFTSVRTSLSPALRVSTLIYFDNGVSTTGRLAGELLESKAQTTAGTVRYPSHVHASSRSHEQGVGPTQLRTYRNEVTASDIVFAEYLGVLNFYAVDATCDQQPPKTNAGLAYQPLISAFYRYIYLRRPLLFRI
ncbi:hypothetical protein PC9H_001512 [Pleurotus ostreatus]|uniref:Uncharacterized protein n=1 Tax=Pleurotus ostreatus TaxID=5322 RepID=A0A8H7A393_PLEOS|nr:uncharacterized protein PC9H_001512 [Pleurotus ostreatus]KAF7441163.1 hypothetical protein PC9H_001512 [Pleurotus ostreatus]